MMVFIGMSWMSNNDSFAVSTLPSGGLTAETLRIDNAICTTQRNTRLTAKKAVLTGFLPDFLY